MLSDLVHLISFDALRDYSQMDQDWILQKKETRRAFSKSTWVPLRAAEDNEHGNVKTVGYNKEFFGCWSVAFKKNREIAGILSWSDIGLSRTIGPYTHEEGYT